MTMTMPETYENKKIPLFARESLDNYINRRVPTGGFLEAILSNDLADSFARADKINAPLIGTYIKWIYNNAPHNCWGSREIVAKWLKGKTYNAQLI